jgi:hypothetical protein
VILGFFLHVVLAAWPLSGKHATVDEIGAQHFVHHTQVRRSPRFQEAAHQRLVLVR